MVVIHQDFQCSLCKIVVKHWDMCCLSRCSHLMRLCARLPDLSWVLDEDSAIHELVQTVTLNCSFGQSIRRHVASVNPHQSAQAAAIQQGAKVLNMAQ